jgi:hypothetical protein
MIQGFPVGNASSSLTPTPVLKLGAHFQKRGNLRDMQTHPSTHEGVTQFSLSLERGGFETGV